MRIRFAPSRVDSRDSGFMANYSLVVRGFVRMRRDCRSGQTSKKAKECNCRARQPFHAAENSSRDCLLLIPGEQQPMFDYAPVRAASVEISRNAT